MSNGYAKSGQVDEAIKLFNTVKDSTRRTAALTWIKNDFVNVRLYKEGLRFFNTIVVQTPQEKDEIDKYKFLFNCASR